MNTLPKLTLKLAERNPNWDGNNFDDYQKYYEIEVEVVQLNLNTGGMRVRYEWPDKNVKRGVSVQSRDVSIEHFYKHYRIIEEKRMQELSWQGVDRQGGI